MKVRRSIAAVAAAALLGGGGAIALPAIASAGSVTHMLKFTSVTKSSLAFTKTNTGQQDTDVNSKGKTVGFDMLNSTVNTKTGTGTILVTVNASGGFLIGYLPVTKGKLGAGTITGGVGAFKDAFGSITAKLLNKAGTKVAVTISYHT
jgi:hypothetical protein